jgi:hypothetical protein
MKIDGEEIVVEGKPFDGDIDVFECMKHIYVIEWLEKDSNDMCLFPHVLKEGAPKWAHRAIKEERERFKKGIKL